MARLVRIVIQLPAELKFRLDELKQQGYTASGFIRAVLEREFAKPEHNGDNKDHNKVDGQSTKKVHQG